MPDDRQDLAATASSTGLVDTVVDWLMTQSLGDAPAPDLFGGCCERMHAIGIPTVRAHLAFRILHPLYGGFGITWQYGQDIETQGFIRDGPVADIWYDSPHYYMIENAVHFMRRRLTGDDALLDFPILEELRDQGGTDYVAYAIEFVEGSGDGIIGSWTTNRKSGFSEADIAALQRIQQSLAVAFKMHIRSEVSRIVMKTYLGSDAGLRVLEGQIGRGDGDSIHSVIWYSDLRDFTRMTDTMAPEHYRAILNNYFECTAGSVLKHGGEVLSFIGDAVLAIFPIKKGGLTRKRACQKALRAAREAQRRLAKVNDVLRKAGEAPLAFGLALHVGDVEFGNIGVPERLSFSVIGPTVNEVARLESLTKTLDRSVLVSSAVAEAAPMDWESLGTHRLRGVGQALEIFALPEEHQG